MCKQIFIIKKDFLALYRNTWNYLIVCKKLLLLIELLPWDRDTETIERCAIKFWKFQFVKK